MSYSNVFTVILIIAILGVVISLILKLFKLALVIVGVAIVVSLVACSPENSTLTATTSGMVYITADHIDEEQMIGYEKIYSDANKDIGIYLNTNYMPELPALESEVSVNGDKAKVRSHVDTYGFVIEADWKVYSGMSGSRVVDADGDVIGYVSSAKEDAIYCVGID